MVFHCAIESMSGAWNMFFANDMHGEKIHIDNADVALPYFCPACGGAMVQKRGNINAHHFAHRAGKECDPWYAGKMSLWHSKMQNQFDKKTQEIVVWNKTHTEYHIADVALQANGEKYILEFQHSSISQKDFIVRSKFYLENGYKVIWVFDFCEHKTQKRVYIAEEYENNMIHLIWPGKDRIRFLDNIDFSSLSGHLYIFFHINTGKGKIQVHDPDGYYSWETWEYLDPFSRCPCFILLNLNIFNGTYDFFAKRYSEQAFYRGLKSFDQ